MPLDGPHSHSELCRNFRVCAAGDDEIADLPFSHGEPNATVRAPALHGLNPTKEAVRQRPAHRGQVWLALVANGG
ncbi:MAG: hypothetical protein L0G76_07480, partial [Brevibacterium sandarakinum]|nr:hypothetical protein [Brevibacterium sandarakinum]